ncbi:hypothetical protein AYO44_00655 [Planctomycetaceae bacterium SCGC AG-212-F19]|nr:hypothetical protein AYO44_00655 [Planctomycetaceae bacterium SCGC AG-212-F19]
MTPPEPEKSPQHKAEPPQGEGQGKAGEARHSPAADADMSEGGHRRAALARAAQRVGTHLGKYRITGVLGLGGMGVVYKAHDPMVDREVAIKLLPAELAQDDKALQRFLLEARTAGKLSHPNTVAVYDVGQDGEAYFLVLELVPGGSVESRLKIGKLSWREATRIVADACKGLGAAHDLGMVHRDLKPSNLLIAADGTVKIADFGLAKSMAGLGSGLTQVGQVIGTPYFMSPEQCEGRPMDGRGDIYSLGATFYRLLTGKKPYEHSETTMQVMYAQCNYPPPDPSEIAPDIPAQCRAIVFRAMAKQPADRYQSAREMLNDLLALRKTYEMDSGSVAAPPADQPGMGSTPSQAMTRVISRGVPQSPPIQPDVGAHPPRSGRPTWVWPMVGVAALLLAVGAFFAFRAGNTGRTPTGPGTATSAGAPIRVGILHSLTGTMAISETSVVDATMLAIGEINDSGGLLGRRIESVVVDGQSDWPTFKREAERLIKQEKVCTVFGCWTSASRKTVRPVFEELDHLLIYPVQYEGLELSPNIFYTGAAPNQQLLPAVTWCLEAKGYKKFFLVGSDYVFPRSANEIIRDELKGRGGQIVGEAYIPLGSTQVRPIVQKIVDAKPDVILNTINGDSNVAFFRELRAAGITPAMVPTISFSIAEQELRSMNTKDMVGDYAAWNYFQSIARPENQQFLKQLLAKYPTRAATDPMEAAYIGVRLWAQAVTDAGSDDVKAIRKALRNQSLDAPEGRVRIDPETQHLWKTARIGEIQTTGQFKIVWESAEPIAPLPYPKTRRPEEWKDFLQGLQNQWNGQWAAPAK